MSVGSYFNKSFTHCFCCLGFSKMESGVYEGVSKVSIPGNPTGCCKTSDGQDWISQNTTSALFNCLIASCKGQTDWKNSKDNVGILGLRGHLWRPATKYITFYKHPNNFPKQMHQYRGPPDSPYLITTSNF